MGLSWVFFCTLLNSNILYHNLHKIPLYFYSITARNTINYNSSEASVLINAVTTEAKRV